MLIQDLIEVLKIVTSTDPKAVINNGIQDLIIIELSPGNEFTRKEINKLQEYGWVSTRNQLSYE